MIVSERIWTDFAFGHEKMEFGESINSEEDDGKEKHKEEDKEPMKLWHLISHC